MRDEVEFALPADRIHVSAWVVDELQVHRTKPVHFTMKGVGYGRWESDRQRFRIQSAQVVVMATWIDAPPVRCTVQLDVRDTEGQVIVPTFFTFDVVIPRPHFVYLWNVSLGGVTIPTGLSYLWASINGALKAPVALEVVAPVEPWLTN
jgi:hypothetical protein